jgi:hypothetical protein
MFTSVQIFDYSGDPMSLTFTESDHGIAEVNDPAYVSSYTEAFDRAVASALDPGSTARYLKGLAERVE